MDLMTVLCYYCQRFPTIFTQSNHWLNVWCACRALLLTEAVERHTGDASFESEIPACYLKCLKRLRDKLFCVNNIKLTEG